jgi:hypothetical protein
LGDDTGDDDDEEDVRVADVDDVELARLVSAMEALAASRSADELVARRSLRLALGWWSVDAPHDAADGHGVVKSDSSDAADEDDDVVSAVEQSCESMCAEADEEDDANALAAAVQPAERRRLSPTTPSVITSSSTAAADCELSAAALGPVSPVLTLRGRRSGLTCRRLVGPRGACGDWSVGEGDEGEEADDVAEEDGWGSGSAAALRLLPVVVPMLVASSMISLR